VTSVGITITDGTVGVLLVFDAGYEIGAGALEAGSGVRDERLHMHGLPGEIATVLGVSENTATGVDAIEAISMLAIPGNAPKWLKATALLANLGDLVDWAPLLGQFVRPPSACG
jgi:hypothetical protein